MKVAVVARLAAAALLVTAAARAEAPSPARGHPRMLLDAPLRAAWQDQATRAGSPAARAIALCNDARTTHKYDGAQYQGYEWAKTLQACLVAWGATTDPQHAATSIKFFTALIDDLDRIGDGKGGDKAAWRDSGYAIRMLGPYTALAYDWLYDQMPAELRARARRRWASWLTWYAEHGYRARSPGNNYQAGYLIAATTIAIAQAGEGDPAVWTRVADELWGKDMVAALATGGILEGGDWAEGWQYGPLSVAEYALSMRIASRAGIPVAGVEPWLSGLLRRHVYALSPGDRVYAGGDTENETPNLGPALLTLDAIALGDARPDDRRWARGEIARLHLHDDGSLLYDALAAVGDPPAEVPRTSWPTWYETVATGTVYARTRWDAGAVWLVTTCQHALDVDHRHPDAGNFVLSRGKDDLIVDPSPYGTQSTLTSNAPSIASGRLPPKYVPSQGAWSKGTGWDWTTQTRSGVVAARCDYSDQFRFQDRASDVPEAMRDLVLLPSADRGDASLVVIDRASTGGSGHAMFLRFRVPGELVLDPTEGAAPRPAGGAVGVPTPRDPAAPIGATASRIIGASRLTIASVARSSGEPVIGRTKLRDCFADVPHQGRCDAARFDVTDLRLEVQGPQASAVHLISATSATSATAPGAEAVPRATPLSGDGWAGVRVAGPRDAVVVWPTHKSQALAYRAPRTAAMTHVILDPHHQLGITTRIDGDSCAVSVVPDGGIPARPGIVVLDDACRVTVDPPTQSAAAALGPRPPPVKKAQAERSRRFGCSAHKDGAGDTGLGGSAAIALAAVALARIRRRTDRAV